MRTITVLFIAVAYPLLAQQPDLPRQWIDPDTGHRGKFKGDKGNSKGISTYPEDTLAAVNQRLQHRHDPEPAKDVALRTCQRGQIQPPALF